MNKQELVNEIAEKAGTSKKDTEKVLNAFMESVGDALQNGEKVQLVGFGTFETKERQAREGRNPATGETIKIPAKTVASFKVGTKLQDKVNS